MRANTTSELSFAASTVLLLMRTRSKGRAPGSPRTG